MHIWSTHPTVIMSLTLDHFTIYIFSASHTVWIVHPIIDTPLCCHVSNLRADSLYFQLSPYLYGFGTPLHAWPTHPTVIMFNLRTLYDLYFSCIPHCLDCTPHYALSETPSVIMFLNFLAQPKLVRIWHPITRIWSTHPTSCLTLEHLMIFLAHPTLVWIAHPIMHDRKHHSGVCCHVS